MDTEHKLDLFKDAFPGRRDIVPRLWISKDKSKTGYSPLCKNEWKEGICSKPCRTCQNADYIPLSDEHLLGHFNGKHILGVYPLLEDNTCHFLAADFDDHDGIRNPHEDVKAFAAACELQEIPCYVLRSKSGAGYHAYIFFSGPVPAAKARAVVFALLQEAEVIGPDVALSSFDRLFPNQGRLNGRGFGNLIALPFQGEAARRGHTLILDPSTEYKDPYPKQMEALAGIRRVPESKLEELIQEWNLKPGTKPATAPGGASEHTGHEENAQEALKCEFLAWAMKNPAKVPEPLWYAMISNLVRLTGGFSLCHEASREHPEYSEQETTRKIHQALDASGPHTCEWLRDNGFICTELGKCKAKSPAGLARIGEKRGKEKSPPSATDVGGLQKDYGHALILSELFLDRFRWAEHRGAWMEYNGKVWKPAPEAKVAKIASDELRTEYSGQLAETRDKHEIQRIGKALQETCMYARICGGLSFLRGWEGILTLPEEWDADPWALNVGNGSFDLHTGGLRPHNPRDLFTQLAPTDYTPNAQGRYWEKHLALFLPNRNIRRQVQRDLGVALVGTTLEERLPIWYGRGRNAKSTTARVFMDALGDYAIRAAPSLLIQKKYETHPTELADLVARRLVVSVEVDDGNRLAEALVKDLTGGDRKKARYMRGDFFEFEQSFSIILIVNHKPIVRGIDEGIWRRINLIPWEQQIPESEQRPQDEVIRELAAENSAILGWMLAGLADWQKDHHWTAPEVQAATEKYRGEQDALGAFLGETCELGPRCVVPVRELRERYEGWCEGIGEEPLNARTFNRMLRDRGMNQAPKGKDRTKVWQGLRLKREGG